MQEYQNIVVLTGAGISAESGIATFSGTNGLWENHAMEDIASPEGFEKNPVLVQDFYNQRRAELQLSQVKPNAAHLALAEFEKTFSGNFTLITQNIDDLHERAGSKNVLQMHGKLLQARCISSGKTLRWTGDLSVNDKCTCCVKPKALRPDIVWFGEKPLYMEKISDLLQYADLFVAIGTSGNVYPAAGFVQIVKQFNTRSVELNLGPSNSASNFSETYFGLATELVPRFFASLV